MKLRERICKKIIAIPDMALPDILSATILLGMAATAAGLAVGTIIWLVLDIVPIILHNISR